MQTTEIVERVQERAELESFQDANSTVIALLETLAMRDLKDEREDFAAQLPKEFGQLLTVEAPEVKEQFDAAENCAPGGTRTWHHQRGKPNAYPRSLFCPDGGGV